MPACSSIYRLRAFFACFPAPCGFLFLSFSYSFRGVRTLFLFSGSPLMPFLSFSRVRSLLLSRRFRSHRVPLYPVPSVPRSFPSLLSLVVGRCVIAFRLFPSRLPSRYSVPWGGEAVPVPWAGGLPRGVELRGWRGVLSFRWAARFLRYAGRGVLVGFFMWKL